MSTPMRLALTTQLKPRHLRDWFKHNKVLAIGLLCLAMYLLSTAIAWLKSLGGAPRPEAGGVTLFFAIVLLGYSGAIWATRKVLWRLRNRLLVTYIFIGVIPIFLLLLLAIVTGVMFSGQYVTQRMRTRFNERATQVEMVTTTVGARLAELSRQLAVTKEEFVNDIRALYPTAEVTVYADSGIRGALPLATERPAWTKDDYRGFVYDAGSFYLRVVKKIGVAPKQFVVITSVPVGQALFGEIISGLASADVTVLHGVDIVYSAKNDEGVKVKVDSWKGDARDEEKAFHKMKAGEEPPHRFRGDFAFGFSTLLPITDWPTGRDFIISEADGSTSTVLVRFSTRASAIYSELFASMGRVSQGIYTALIAIAATFAVIEFFALFIAFRLTRSITRAVAKLYNGTQRVNKGDFSCCIEVKSEDQLAELEKSFNSMTQSLESLIAEQKEKQRMESELAIAQEVQEQLFPKHTQPVQGLDLHGVCLPARTVSGDYYDFVPLDDENLLIALGDISGKGISAALLMATLHSAVRSYDLRRLALPEPATMAVAGMSSVTGLNVLTGSPSLPGPGPQCCVGTFMESLNTQLYKSTPSSKYATLFLGCFHARSGLLTYSNGGHLAPIVISIDGTVRRLETGGSVVGLIPGMSYEQSTVEFKPGDLLVAFTDGITEPEDAYGNDFGEERLIEIVRENRARALPELANTITAAVKQFIGNAEQPDDMTLVLARAR